jgi:hypothetical protein
LVTLITPKTFVLNCARFSSGLFSSIAPPCKNPVLLIRQSTRPLREIFQRHEEQKVRTDNNDIASEANCLSSSAEAVTSSFIVFAPFSRSAAKVSGRRAVAITRNPADNAAALRIQLNDRKMTFQTPHLEPVHVQSP